VKGLTLTMLTLALAVAGIVSMAPRAQAAVEDLEINGFFAQDWISWGNVDTCLGVVADDGTEVRSARVSAKGKIAENLKFKVDYDFAGGSVGLTDAYLELAKIPGVGNARVGFMNEPMGLDQLTSTKFITFLERASCTTFVPARNSGLMLWNSFAGGKVTVEAGGFRESDTFGAGAGSGEGGAVTGRITGLLMNADDGKKLLHVAASATMRSPYGDVVRYRERPEIHMADRFVDTGNVPAESVTTMGLEVAGVFGPAHFQGEYLMSNITTPDETGDGGDRGRAENPSFSGYYAQAGYFLTGESRGYKGTCFDRTKTNSNFLEKGGFGAWEVAARYSSLDLSEAADPADPEAAEHLKMDDITVGLNWYMSSYARVMFNYIMSSVKDADDEEMGKANALTARMQFDF
jgi:phosphate-selective porin OprO/OprP